MGAEQAAGMQADHLCLQLVGSVLGLVMFVLIFVIGACFMLQLIFRRREPVSPRCPAGLRRRPGHDLRSSRFLLAQNIFTVAQSLGAG